ncbi:hypothetical protein D3C86_1567120 [compost metagenome]
MTIEDLCIYTIAGTKIIDTATVDPVLGIQHDEMLSCRGNMAGMSAGRNVARIRRDRSQLRIVNAITLIDFVRGIPAVFKRKHDIAVSCLGDRHRFLRFRLLDE